MSKFASEGFDLDAVQNNPDAILEVGGGVSVPTAVVTEETMEDPVLQEAEELKQDGNESFKEQDYDKAYALYTAAIQAVPGMTADELLQKEKEFFDDLNKRLRLEMQEQDDRRREAQKKGETYEEPLSKPRPEFEVPPHKYGKELAVYHCNRAATLMHLHRNDDALRDCNVAVLWSPNYVKAFTRRATVHERLNDIEQALADVKQAQALEPSNATIRANVKRLQKLEDERMEKLKTETFDKLKELGNSLLGNFGMSLDNFKADKDPNTGSYSISFNQN